MATLGKVWVEVGSTRPIKGTEVTNTALSAALAQKQLSFTSEELVSFQVRDSLLKQCSGDGCFIAADGMYYKPLGTRLNGNTHVLLRT